jgi:hypothetical protein
MFMKDLAEYLRGEGVEVRGVLNQTTPRPGQYPDVVVPIGLELENGLCLYKYGDSRVWLYWWRPEEEDWVEIGGYETAKVDDLVRAIKDHRPA